MKYLLLVLLLSGCAQQDTFYQKVHECAYNTDCYCVYNTQGKEVNVTACVPGN